MSVEEDKVEFAIQDVLNALVNVESMYRIDYSNDFPIEPNCTNKVDALRSFLKGTKSDNKEVMRW